jgi:hypothetical protein
MQVTLLFVAPLAHAEVMDKEPSLAEVWLVALPLAVLSFFACRFSPFLSLLTLPLPVLYLVAFLGEVTDPWGGPAMLSEVGWLYVVGCTAAFIAVAVAHLLGVVQWRRKGT